MPSSAKKAKGSQASDELHAVQQEYVRVVGGKLPGGQWGSNLEHLKKKVAEAQAVDLSEDGGATAPDEALVTTKRIDAIQAEIEDPATPNRYISDMIKQRDLLIANHKIEKKKNRAPDAARA